MAFLMDAALVGITVGIAVLLTLRYIWNLARPADLHTPAHCAGCEVECDARELVLSAWTPLRPPTRAD